MPVAVAKVERQLDSGGGELVFQSCQQSAVLSIDRTDATEMVIVLGHFEHSLAWDVASAKDVLEEWQHVFAALRTAKGDE